MRLRTALAATDARRATALAAASDVGELMSRRVAVEILRVEGGEPRARVAGAPLERATVGGGSSPRCLARSLTTRSLTTRSLTTRGVGF